MESIHTYDYTVKVAGNLDKKLLDLFLLNLKKFDPIEISEPTTTPIQKNPFGFSNISNEPVNIIKAKFRYPATEPMVRQMAQLIGIDMNHVRLVKTGYDDSVVDEMEGYANQMDHSPILTHEEMEEQPGAKEASKAYGNSYLDSIKDQTTDDKIDIPYAAKKTPDAFDPFKPETWAASEGKSSPMSKMTRPAKPQTGAHKG